VSNQTGGGSAFFAGGPNARSSEMSETIDLTGAQPEIDAGNLPVTLGADLGGFSTQGDNATVAAEFWKDAETRLGAIQVGPVSAADRNGTTTLQHRSTTEIVPPGTTFAVIRVSFQRTDGTYNDRYADNLSLTLGGPPHTRITAGPAGPTNNSTPSFEFAADPAEGATFECRLDAADFAAWQVAAIDDPSSDQLDLDIAERQCSRPAVISARAASSRHDATRAPDGSRAPALDLGPAVCRLPICGAPIPRGRSAELDHRLLCFDPIVCVGCVSASACADSLHARCRAGTGALQMLRLSASGTAATRREGEGLRKRHGLGHVVAMI
jgi:hypothetical protein